VLDVAIALTGELGLDEVTIRAIADRLGVWPTTVKHHLGDIDDVKDAIADEVAGASRSPAGGAPDGAPGCARSPPVPGCTCATTPE
jgi:AcrR family transcriptional regulator